jgi:serine/threonine protein kinase
MSFCEIMNDNHHIVKLFDNSKKNKKYLIENFNEQKIEATLEDTVFSYTSFPNEEEKKLFKDLVINMLMINHKERYNVESILQHSYWFSKDYKTFTLGTSCSEVPVENYNLEYINQLHLYGVFDVIDYCKKELKNLPLETFFMAIDIYLRVCSKCEFREFMTKKKVKTLAKYCCLVAYKYFNWSESDEEIHYDIVDISTYEEIEIYKALEGKIRTERYFKAAETYEDLVNVFNGLIYPSESNEAYFEIGKEQFVINKNIINYLNQDAKTYILSQRPQEFYGNKSLENSKNFSKHELKISDFFKY